MIWTPQVRAQRQDLVTDVSVSGCPWKAVGVLAHVRRLVGAEFLTAVGLARGRLRLLQLGNLCARGSDEFGVGVGMPSESPPAVNRLGK
jgi:hypothetical protein